MVNDVFNAFTDMYSGVAQALGMTMDQYQNTFLTGLGAFAVAIIAAPVLPLLSYAGVALSY